MQSLMMHLHLCILTSPQQPFNTTLSFTLKLTFDQLIGLACFTLPDLETDNGAGLAAGLSIWLSSAVGTISKATVDVIFSPNKMQQQ